MDRGEVLVGHWVTSVSPVAIEVMGYGGADFVAIDCEHGPISALGDDLETCIRAADAAGVSAIVRISSHSAAEIAHAGDLGAKGVIVPHVNTAAELEVLLSRARFPPHGTRGCNPSVRAARYGATPWAQFARDSEETFTVVPLLEEPAAFEDLDALLDVAGLRAVAIGPFDLAARLGGVGAEGAARRVAELRARLLAGCRRRSVSLIDAGASVEAVKSKVQDGVRGILYSADVVLLADAMSERMDHVRRFLRERRS